MSVFEAIVMGVIQGLTEFLPVSSSGHLELANYLFGISGAENMQFAIAVHAATVVSTIVVFWRELGRLLRGFFRFRLNDETVYIINIFISMLPIAFVGLFFKKDIEALFTGNLMLVGTMLLVTACLLTWSHFARPRFGRITPKNAFIIGIAQALAVLPGLSRSGSTISTALLLGVRREEAARFSFLMVLLPILGMNFLEVVGGNMGDAVGSASLTAGFVSAFVTGTLACRWMLRLVAKGRLVWFAGYCAAVGILSICLWIFR